MGLSRRATAATFTTAARGVLDVLCRPRAAGRRQSRLAQPIALAPAPLEEVHP